MTSLATVIGAQGFIGSQLLAHLRRLGWQAEGMPRLAPAGWRQRHLGTVFFCAGLTADYLQRPHDTVSAHVSLLNDVLREDRFDSLVYLSSTRLYDSAHAAIGQALDEDAPLHLNPSQPRHLFDLSKALGESLCRQASGGRARIARLSCVVAGAGTESGFVGQLLQQLVHCAQSGQAALSVASTAQHERDYVHIDDVLPALLHIGTAGTQAAYNLASGSNLSNAALFERLAELSGVLIQPTQAAEAAAQGQPAVVSIARLQREFNWQPTSLMERLPQLWREAQPCCV